MKKRVISLFMALVMCLSLVPTAVWAEAAEGVDNNVEQAGLYENKDENGAMEEQEPGEDDENALDSEEESDEPSIDVVRTQGAENGIAVQADNTAYVAEVTVNGKTKQYADIDDAFAAAQEADSATVKLLADVTISHDDYSGITLKKGNITLDLNGKTLSKSKGDDNGFYAKNAVFWLSPPGATTKDEFLAALQKPVRLTVQDSAGGGKIVQPNGGPAIIVTLNTILTVKGGTVENTSSVDHDNQSHMAPNCAVLLSGGGKAVINGGTLRGMRGVAVTGYITKEEEDLYKEYFGIEGYNNDTYGNELTVTGGDISGTSGEALVVYEKAKKIELSGGTFTTQSNDYSIWVDDTEDGEQTFKGDAASLLVSGYRFENNGTECAYSENGNGVVGNATVALRPANEYAYIGKDGKLTTQANCTEITAETFELPSGWYVVKGNVEVTELNITNEVNLILCDGATLTVSGHMNVTQGSTLKLYWQSGGTGKLTAASISVLGSMTAPAGEMKQTTGEGGTTFEKCLEHDWEYTNNGDTHTARCKLCGKDGGTAAHEFSKLESTNETTHTFSCVCGKVSTENHPSLSESPNDDGLTHTGRCGLCGYSKAPEKHNFQYSGMCICSAHLTASYNNQSYATLASAVEAAKNGGTVTLERDVEESITITDGMDVTIDLNEKNWGTTRDTGNKPALTVNGGSVTVKNGTMHTGGMASACTPVVINGGHLTVGESMTVQGDEWDDNRYRHAIEINGGELTLSVGTKLVCGMKVADGKTLASYLPEDTAFQQTDYDQGAATGTGEIINGYVREYVGKFTLNVVEHTTHNYTDGVCDCGYACEHKDAEGSSTFDNNGKCKVCKYECEHKGGFDGKGKCETCGVQMAAKVVTGENVTYYANVSEAIRKATDGSTVTVISTERQQSLALNTSVPANAAITLDLNGHTLGGYALKIDQETSRLTVIDNNSGNGRIGLSIWRGELVFNPGNNKTQISQLNVYGGTIKLYGGRILGNDKNNLTLGESVKLADLLPAGYVYRFYMSGTPQKTFAHDATISAVKADWSSAYDLVPEECGHEGLPSDFSDTTCPYCGAELAATVKAKNDQSVGYASLADAIKAVGSSGGTVTLLKDVEEDITVTDGMNVTIDLNRKTWKGYGTGWATYMPVPLTVNGGSVTVQNGTLWQGGASGQANTAVVVSGGSLTVGEGMTIQGSNSGIRLYPAIEVQSGSLTLSVGTKLIYGMRVAEGETLASYLPEGTAFQRADFNWDTGEYDSANAKIINGYVQELTGNFELSVVAHTHSMTAGTDGKYVCACGYECGHEKFNNGVCETCGYECEHPSDSVKNENDVYTCGVCGEQMAVKVESGESTTYYAEHFESNGYTENTLKEVFNEAENGSTITLLADGLAASGWITGKNITLNLNGKKLIENNGIFVDKDDTNTAGKLFVYGEGSSTTPKSNRYPCTFRVLNDSELVLNENFSGDYGTIYLENGVLTSDSTNVKIGALVIQNSEAKITLKGGQFGKIVTDGAVTRTAGSLLERGYAFQKDDDSYVAYDTVITATSVLEDVTVVKCDHQMTEMPTGNQYNKLHCPNCDEALGAVLTTADGKINGYEDLTSSYGETSALSVAETTPGCTVTMYYDADGLGIWSTKEGFTLDANGCTIARLTLSGGTLTVKNATITGDEHTDDPTVMTFYRSDNIAALTLENCLVEEQKESGMATLTANGPVTLKSTSVNGKTSVSSFTNEGLTVDESELNGDVTVRGSLTFKSGHAPKITVYGAAEISGGTINELDATDAGSLTVSGGHFGKITAPDGKQLIACLKDGYAFYSNAKLADGRTGTLEGVYAAEHTHGEYKWDTATHEKVCACGDVKERDTAAPTFDGIADGEIYYQNTLTFTVEDAGSGIKEVKDGETVLIAENGKYTISADNKVHIITATDNAGNSTTVTVTVYKVYTVTLPNNPVGYTVSGNTTVGHGQDYTFTVEIKAGYSATDSFAVKVNGEALTGTLDGSTYTYKVEGSEVTGNLTVTVEGVADVTAPEAEMTIGANKFKELLNSLTFGLFFKETQTVTVTATDLGSGVDDSTAAYLVADGVFDKTSMPTDGWTSFDMKNGKGSFSIEPNAMGSVYVRVKDKDGNLALINSEGMVVYTDSTADTESISFTRLSDKDVSFKVKLNGNAVSSLSIGNTVIDPAQYTASEDGTITLKNDWLKTVAAGKYTVTVTYAPMGVEYNPTAGSGSEAPASTTVKLTVVKRTDRTLTFSAPDAVYDGAEYDDLRISNKPAATVVQYKVKDAEDSTYGATVPTNAGSYTVKITVDADEDYEAATFTKDFTIFKRDIANPVIEVTGSSVYDGNEQKPTVTVKDGDTVIPDSEYTVAYDNNVNAGENTATVTITDKDGGNYVVGEGSTTFTIAQKTVEKPTIVVAEGSVYNGKAQEPTVTVKDGETVIDQSEYTVTYGNNTNAGTATVTIANKDGGNYVVNGNADFTIAQKVITITAKDKTAHVGDKVPDLSQPVLDKDYTVEGLVEGDTLDAVKLILGSVTLEYVDDEGNKIDPDMSKEGDVTIQVTAYVLEVGNYTPTCVDGKLTITKRSSYYYAPSSDAKEQSPGTGDAGTLVYGLTALGGYTGTALVLRRRKRED